MSIAPGWRGTDVIWREEQARRGIKTLQGIGNCTNIMETKEELQKQIKALEDQKKPLEEKLHKIYQQEQTTVEAKLKRCNAGKDKFTTDELIFSATARCECGAGLAYPIGIGIHGCWDCADILLGKAIPAGQEGSKTHSGSMPFAFYEIKSENQPSAYGATTRPK